MIRAIRGIGDLREPTAFRSWLVAIAIRQVRDSYRDRPGAAARGGVRTHRVRLRRPDHPAARAVRPAARDGRGHPLARRRRPGSARAVVAGERRAASTGAELAEALGLPPGARGGPRRPDEGAAGHRPASWSGPCAGVPPCHDLAVVTASGTTSPARCGVSGWPGTSATARGAWPAPATWSRPSDCSAGCRCCRSRPRSAGDAAGARWPGGPAAAAQVAAAPDIRRHAAAGDRGTRARWAAGHARHPGRKAARLSSSPSWSRSRSRW